MLLADAVGSSELWGAVVTMCIAVAGGLTGGFTFLKRHFERRDKDHAEFLKAVGDDHRLDHEEFQKSRTDDREERHKREETHRLDLRKRDDALTHARDSFESILRAHDERFMQAIRDIEVACSKERELDREQRIEDRKLIERMAGLDSGRFKIEEKK